MLAPRQTLWSTPPSALKHLVEWIPLKPGDCVCDIGCGDGRVILNWAQEFSKTGNEEQHSSDSPIVSFIGIDIDSERIQQSQSALKLARSEGRIHAHVSVTFHCANALESKHLFGNANIFFLYLIPRGLRIIKPLLLEQKKNIGNEKTLKVVTYMAPLQGEIFVSRGGCDVAHQPGASWPLYLYFF
jgi:SAM-dependent methyltransferase